jgi:hypothetical protein
LDRRFSSSSSFSPAFPCSRDLSLELGVGVADRHGNGLARCVCVTGSVAIGLERDEKDASGRHRAIEGYLA